MLRLPFASRAASARRLAALPAAAAALLLAGCQEEGHRYDFDPAVISARAKKTASRTPDLREAKIDAALLKAPKEPTCEEKTSGVESDVKRPPVKLASANAEEKVAVQVPTQSDPNKELATRIRLEYDRECFKQAEKRVRAQLEKLQTEVKGRTVASSR